MKKIILLSLLTLGCQTENKPAAPVIGGFAIAYPLTQALGKFITRQQVLSLPQPQQTILQASATLATGSTILLAMYVLRPNDPLMAAGINGGIVTACISVGYDIYQRQQEEALAAELERQQETRRVREEGEALIQMARTLLAQRAEREALIQRLLTLLARAIEREQGAEQPEVSLPADLLARYSQENCSICLQAVGLRPADNLSTTASHKLFVTECCMHAFHLPCILLWLGEDHHCPLCRQPIAIDQSPIYTWQS